MQADIKRPESEATNLRTSINSQVREGLVGGCTVSKEPLNIPRSVSAERGISFSFSFSLNISVQSE